MPQHPKEDRTHVVVANPLEGISPKLMREANLLRLPTFPLQKRLSSRFRSDNHSGFFRHQIERPSRPDGKAGPAVWRVEGPVRPADKSTFVGVESYLRHRFRDAAVPRLVEVEKIGPVLRHMGIRVPGKRDIQGFAESVHRIVGTTLYSAGFWRGFRADRESGREEEFYVTASFHLYDAAYFKGDPLPDGSYLARGMVLRLSDEYLASLNTAKVIPLDYDLWMSLRSTSSPGKKGLEGNYVARRLLEILSPKFYGMVLSHGTHLQQDYDELCEYLPLEPRGYLSQAKASLQTAHEYLVKRRFLGQEPEWEWTAQRRRLVYAPGDRYYDFHHGQQIRLFEGGEEAGGTEEKPRTAAATEQHPEPVLVDELVRRGFEPRQDAETYVRTQAEEVRRQLPWFDYELERQGDRIQSPGAWLRKRIDRRMGKPRGYVSPEEVAAKRRRVEADRDAKRRAAAEEDDRRVNWWKYQTPEEKARSYIDGVWLFRWKNKHGYDREPSQAERDEAYQTQIRKLEVEAKAQRAAYRQETGQVPPEPPGRTESAVSVPDRG